MAFIKTASEKIYPRQFFEVEIKIEYGFKATSFF
jgi:hypothetical protein